MKFRDTTGISLEGLVLEGCCQLDSIGRARSQDESDRTDDQDQSLRHATGWLPIQEKIGNSAL